ncbi:MAG: hypothetical protein K0S24_822 [Sphingobacterium sp.]|jgi:hypothetical protein|nr:hypothetical protein [Sphingobacterium sp.]
MILFNRFLFPQETINEDDGDLIFVLHIIGLY